MYRIDFNGLKDAAHIIHRFMTNTLLVKPECTMWTDSAMPSTIVNNGAAFMSEKDLFRRIMRAASSPISCVAATDQADSRRVVLTYAPGLDFLVLNFPQANGKLTATEKKLIQEICNPQ